MKNQVLNAATKVLLRRDYTFFNFFSENNPLKNISLKINDL